MSNNFNQGTWGGSKRISARPSIHSHTNDGPCLFAYAEAMGRHGLYRTQQHTTANRSQQRSLEYDTGADEVDNVFSKPAIPVSSSFANKSFNRSNSLEIDNLETDNSYDSDVGTVRSLNHNSDTSYQSANFGTPSNLNTPVGNRSTPDGTPVTHRHYNQSGSVANSIKPQLPREQEQSSSKMMWLIILIVGLLVGVGARMLNTMNIMNSVIYDESQFYDDMDHLGYKYRIDENAVLRMQTGIATIFKKQDTGSFMFVYNSNDHSFDPKVFNKFVNDVAVTASKYLLLMSTIEDHIVHIGYEVANGQDFRQGSEVSNNAKKSWLASNESTPVHYTIVEGSQLHMSGHGEFLGRFRDDLDRTGAMLVKHVEEVPSALAMAFHYYCDEYNPLVKKSAIFFTLNLAKCENTGKKSTHAVIEKCLAKKWDSVPDDSIGPLLTRVVSVVIDVTSG